ncbi:MAG: hypothetical protein B7Y37_04735 [Sphingobacteriia bacterium 28-36-52]|jgi:hypothetical protein|nr:MAG: hypothetical protein B7Z27_08360 [Sphingobacteriia bacterium 32-37-4]OYZ01906.1 MAG: hypothetical protein B7Y37_04735 [Sphingobacteriia bacterium 28-36-52]
MKITTINPLVQLNKTELNNLTQVVNETIASNMNNEPKTKKRFTVAQLWKIQRFSRIAPVKPILVY